MAITIIIIIVIVVVYYDGNSGYDINKYGNNSNNLLWL
jgi:uncharacterized membrane protein